MMPFTLPDGYSLASDDLTPRDAVPGYQLYGGADISRASDANGVLHVGCCARGPDGDFRFRVFRYTGNVATDLPLQARASGRGEISIDQYTGRMVWIAWEHSVFYTADVPGAAPFGPPIESQPEAYIPCLPAAYSEQYNGQIFSVGQWIDVRASFGIASARAYYMRVVGKAASADIRVRLGTPEQPGQATVNSQQANIQEHQGWIVNAGPDGKLWLSVVDGNGAVANARVWLLVLGFWPL